MVELICKYFHALFRSSAGYNNSERNDNCMKKTLFKRLCAVLVCAMLCFSFAATGNAAVKVVKHTVIKGESMWLIAVKYQVGLREIIAANDQVKNPALIYPNQILNIPLVAEETTSFEEQVVNLTNQKRRANGLSDLKLN